MKPLLIFLLIVSISIYSCYGQINTNCNWHCIIGNIFNESINSVAADNDGNIYFAGGYFDTLDVDCSQDNYQLNAGTNNSSFFIKYDTIGNVKWAQNLGQVSITSVFISDSNYIYISGNGSLVYFRTSSGLTPFSDLGMTMFFAKLDTSGLCLWARALNCYPPPNLDNASCNSIHTDKFDNVYICGEFTGIYDFDASYPNTHYLTATESFPSDAYIAKYSSSGLFQWAIQTNGNGYEVANKMAINEFEEIFVSGTFSGTPDFNPDTNSYILSNTNNVYGNGSFIAKYNSNGNLIWANHYNNRLNADITALTIDYDNNLIVTGRFNDTISPNFLQPDLYLVPSNSWNIFIAKYSNSGSLLWSNKQSGNGYISSSSTDVDLSGNIYITTEPNYVKAIKYNSLGLKIDSIDFIGYTNSFYAILSQSNIYLCGTFIGSLYIPSDSSFVQLNSNNSNDIFIAKINSSISSLNTILDKSTLFNLFPNPFSTELFLTFNDDYTIDKVEIIDLLGRTIMTGSNIIKEHKFDLSFMKNGIYLCKITYNNNSYSRLIIKQ